MPKFLNALNKGKEGCFSSRSEGLVISSVGDVSVEHGQNVSRAIFEIFVFD